MKQHMTTVGGHDGSYDTWHAEERDDNETTTTTIFGRGSPPRHSHMENISRSGNPPHSDVIQVIGRGRIHIYSPAEAAHT